MDAVVTHVECSAGIMKYGLQNECYRVIIIKRVDPTLIFVSYKNMSKNA
ncbi:unnamed protein product [Wuchereria bancrofti]|uniref:Uncharacterized protein n=1 Tax=Wuchereria bancrofti TaxID=6293 RepID=A0A3P7EPW9_WUCBA|nr:unnamed protein product [Wuchereria bancrofti]